MCVSVPVCVVCVLVYVLCTPSRLDTGYTMHDFFMRTPQVGSLPALIAAAVALGTILDNEVLSNLEKTGVDAVDDAVDDSVELRDNTYASTGY